MMDYSSAKQAGVCVQKRHQTPSNLFRTFESSLTNFTSSSYQYRNFFLYTIIFSFILNYHQPVVQSQNAQYFNSNNELMHKREHSLVKPYQGSGMVSCPIQIHYLYQYCLALDEYSTLISYCC